MLIEIPFCGVSLIAFPATSLINKNNIKLMDTNIHVFRHPDLPKGKKELHEHRGCEVTWDPREDFHTYGCEWNAAQIKWYLDGKLVASRTNEFWHQALDVTLSVGVRAPLNTQPSTNGFPAISQVDYVRVWKDAAATRLSVDNLRVSVPSEASPPL